MTDLVALKAANANRWARAKLTRNFTAVAKRLVAPTAKARYQAVAAKTGVPWFFIAVAHEREASQNWNTQLGQGDPLGSVSVHVPKGRGPFKTWEDGAYDALVNCAPFAARNKDWSIGGTLTMLEQYNGLAYANKGRPSPYIWAGTDVYDPPTGPGGKILVDHGPIENVTDKQLGCAGLLLAMMQIDSTITFTGAAITPAPKPPPASPQSPSVTSPAKGSLGAFFVDLFKSMFGRKS
ncbi:hypothetical protein [Bradyrhizobium elkanii]|uniref:hypothetical protein n=1 Tax=Bradyrhizobium elkanii TaxID=29448 RepID=UPI00271459D3|nr:hypothetical protein [Bradyrhizobium elkanii]WLA50750.1 hypothetical protein QIH80_11545 [Bradyrhizobium elkanii]WLB79013.1 hypothetical protein QIH83_32475 [Bradyrhizobium elkanii]